MENGKEFQKASNDHWIHKDAAETPQNPLIEDYTNRLRAKKTQVKTRNTKKGQGKPEQIKQDVSFDLVIGDHNEEELEYILLNKRQHYIEVVNSLDSCLREAQKKPETQETLPELAKVH